MAVSGDWITPRVNGDFFFEKPPLLYWTSAAFIKLFGATPLAVRLTGALLAIMTIWLIAATAARVWNRRAGFLAGLALATGLLLVMTGRMGIMDAPLAFLTTVTLLTYARWRQRGGLLSAAVFGLLVGLGLLLKGLAGGLAPAIAVLHLATHRARGARLSLVSVLLAVILAGAVTAPWFAAMSARHGQLFYHVFVEQQHGQRMAQAMQQHGGPVYYYLALLAFACFPWIVFLPSALSRPGAESEEQAFWRTLALVWLLVVLIPFSLVKTKLPGYAVPLLPAAALLSGVGADRALERLRRGPFFVVIIFGLFFGAAVALLPLFGMKAGARYGASAQALELVVPVAIWVGGYITIIIGAVLGLERQARRALHFLALGQVLAVAAVLGGVLPVLSPFLGGGPSELARLAQEQLPDYRLILYETRPEAVAFTLQRPVPVYSHHQQEELLAALEEGPTALMAPAKEQQVWGSLPYRQRWRTGLDVLLELPAVPD
jgi:4-amino-4-deoxy-L-arabinose transferase-like glycosyltransferase